VRLEGLGQLKKSDDIGNRTRDLSAQPAAQPRSDEWRAFVDAVMSL
jgi:hypothetical protein